MGFRNIRRKKQPFRGSSVLPTMTDQAIRASTRLLYGAIAGFVATAAMTAAMTSLHRRLPKEQRYPLPPKEITQQTLPAPSDQNVRDTAMAAHFAYGAATGALVGMLSPRPGNATGAAAGLVVWAGSYLGWVPAFSILKPATEHPMRRNALMISVHLVWGVATARTLRDLFLARSVILNGRKAKDAVPSE